MNPEIKNDNKPTVLAVGLFVFGFSFTRVFEFLFEHLSVDFDIHWLGIGYKGEVIRHKHYTLYPSNTQGGDVYGAYGAAALATELDVQSVLLLNDFFMLKNYAAAWTPLKKRGIKLVAYVPMDGSFIVENEVKDAFFLDELVLYHQGAVNDIRSTINKYFDHHPEERNKIPKLTSCYHGIDLRLFSPPPSSEDKMELKKKLFPVDEAEGAVFMLNANRYNERKNLKATIDAFVLAKPACKVPVFLVLHTPNMNEVKTKEIQKLINESGYSDFILLNPVGEQYCDDSTLADLYRACDIGINTSYGEGWGLISFEHAACGAAQIVPDHTCPGEIWKEVGLITPVKEEIRLDTSPFLMFGIDTVRLSEQIISLVSDHNMLEMVSEKCLKHAANPAFRWETIAKQWKNILENPLIRHRED